MKKKEKVNIGIIGIGGYGNTHLKSILDSEGHGLCRLKAAVIRNPDKYKEEAARLLSTGVRIYRNHREMFIKEAGVLDLISIVCGIHEHEAISIMALEHGFNVLCEKPVAGNIEQGQKMNAAKQRSGKLLAIGYQNIYSPNIQRIKSMTLEHKLGRLIKAKGIAMSPRTSSYYRRNSWAGKIQADGKIVMDSPIQNAAAHSLQNMLYVAGPSLQTSAVPSEIYGECYRVKDIESADTQYVRVQTTGGVQVVLMASHAVSQDREIEAEYWYEKGKIIWKDSGKTAVYLHDNGKERAVETFDNGKVAIEFLVYRNVITAIQQGEEPLCSIDNAFSHTICVDKLFESSGDITTVDDKYGEKTETAEKDDDTFIKGLNGLMDKMYREEKSFYESGVPWATKSQTVIWR